MSDKPKVLYVCSPAGDLSALPEALRSWAEVVVVHNPLRALAKIAHDHFDGIYVAADQFQAALRLRRLLENDRILEGMPDAVALLDADYVVLWANNQLLRWCNRGNIIGERFFAALGNPDVIGCDGYPLIKALQNGLATSSLLKMTGGRYLQMHAAPIATP